jgi:cation transport ATPase
MVTSGDIGFYSAVLFKMSLLILAVLLGLQLIHDQLPFKYDIMYLFSWEQFVFAFAVLIITILSFIEGFTLQKRDGFNFGVLVEYIIASIGAFFVIQIFVFRYDFDSSSINMWMGYFLLVGALMILVNAREQFGQLIKKK